MNPHAFELILKHVNGARDILFALSSGFLDHEGDALVFIGLKVEKRKVLKLPFYRRDTQTIGKRCVNIHGFACFEHTAIGTESSKCSHIMQSICKFDDDNANVLGHRQKHFAQVERLLLVHRGNFDRRELCHAIYQFGDSFAKTFLNVFKRSRSVFDRIMQNSCDNGVFIHMQVFCKDIAHFDRMIDIRFTRLAVLFGVITRGKRIRCIDARTHLIIKA